MGSRLKLSSHAQLTTIGIHGIGIVSQMTASLEKPGIHTMMPVDAQLENTGTPGPIATACKQISSIARKLITGLPITVYTGTTLNMEMPSKNTIMTQITTLIAWMKRITTMTNASTTMVLN